jgi:DNA-binding NtrC family response regulator
MHRLFETLTRFEGTLLPVLVEGEVGVGKQRTARALHQGSPAAKGAFVVVDCAKHQGPLPFDSARDGCLVLSEVTALNKDAQQELLEHLDRQSGATPDDLSAIQLPRIIAVTSRSLEDCVRRGAFSDDLLYRFAIRVFVPPLRDRREDVGVLAQSFADELGMGRLESGFLAQLTVRQWPNNVGELKQFMVDQAEKAPPSGVSQGVQASVDDLETIFRNMINVERPYLEQKDAICNVFTKLYLDALLTHTSGNRTAAARLAELDRTYVGRLLLKYGFTRSSKEDTAM